MRKAALLTPVLTLVSMMSPNVSNGTPSPDASRITLEVTCTAGDDNCFDKDAATVNGGFTDLLDWVLDTRKPSETLPLMIDIDPGTYSVPSHRRFCDGDAVPNAGHITVRGSGADNTVLTGGRNGPASGFTENLVPTIDINNCSKINFQDLTIRSDAWDGSPGSVGGVSWLNGGSSTWSNVHVQAKGSGWIDGCSSSGSRGLHYWLGSTLETKVALESTGWNSIPYYSTCGDNWIYGGELLARNDATNTNGVIGAFANSAESSIRIFGSAVRSMADPGSAFGGGGLAYGFGGLLSAYEGSIHMHGGIVAVDASGSTNEHDVYGLMTYGTTAGTIHTPGIAYNLKAGGNGKAVRVVDANTDIPALGVLYEVDPYVAAPYQWPSSYRLPPIESVTGADVFVETDCMDDGNCDPTFAQVIDGSIPKHPHQMLYDKSCATAGPWFDSTTGRCRGEGP